MSSRSSKHVSKPRAVSANEDEIQNKPHTREDALRVISEQVRQHLGGLRRFVNDRESGRAVLETLENTLRPLVLRDIGCADVTRDISLRRDLSLVFGSEMEREESYTLADLKALLDRHVSKLPALFQYPALSRTLAASILAPALYPFGVCAGHPDVETELSEVVSRLQRHGVDVNKGRSLFNCWQELALESLVAGYRDQMSALTPKEYLHVSRIAPHSVRLDGVFLERVCSAIIESLQGVGAHPRVLFEVLHPDTRAHVAQRLTLPNAVEWLRSEMQGVTNALAHARSTPLHSESDHLLEGLWNSENRAVIQIQRLIDAVRFFNLYHERIPRDAEGSTRFEVQADVPQSVDPTVKGKPCRSRDLLKKELSRVSAELMEELGLTFRCVRAAVVCERELAFTLAEFFADTSVMPDESVRRLPSGLQERIFSWEQLLPGVERLLASGDFESAANMRLLFPLEKAGYSVHDTVDQYIQKNQNLVIHALSKQASKLRKSMIVLAKTGIREFPEELKLDLLAYCQGMERFLSPDSIYSSYDAEPFGELVRALSPLVRGLLAWDGIVERVRSSNSLGGELSHPFQGGAVAATLVSIVRSNPKMQRSILKRCWSLEGVSEGPAMQEVLLSRDGLLAFVKLTDEEFRSARNEVELHKGGSFDISYESERARRAQLLYDLAVDKREQAIKTSAGLMQPELEIGSRIVQLQERRAAQQAAAKSPIARHEQEMLRFLLEGKFAKGRPLGPLVERCREAIEKGTAGTGPAEVKLEERAFDMLVTTVLEGIEKAVTNDDVQWVKEKLVGRFLAPFESRHLTSRRKMARVLRAILESQFGAELYTEPKARAELVAALNELIKGKVHNEEQSLPAWRAFFDSTSVVAWRRRMGVS